MHKNFTPSVLALSLMSALSAFAQTSTSPTAAAAAATATPPSHLERVVTTGNPLGSAALSHAVEALDGDALTLTRGATLGDTLAGLPGVAATSFGPNSSRPAIRGLDGDRVRMLSNSGASVDASSLSFDHAVPVDPLVIDRVEVLRGAASLLYGGNAIGGVVNTLDNRIPRKLTPGLSGAAEVRLGGAARERNGAVVLDGGIGKPGEGFAWHADLAARNADDLRVPRLGEVRNSAAESRGGALGGSVIFAGGYAGLSFDDYRNDYGVTVEPDVMINMRRKRLATAGEWRSADGPLRRISWQGSRTRYEHQEVEGSGAVGTRFANRGSEARVEAEHAPLGPVRGVIGLQWERTDFRVNGEEALVPDARTGSTAVFLLEQYTQGPLSLSAGLRAERLRVDSAGDAAGSEEPKFGPASRFDFKPRSASLSAGYKLSGGFSLSANLTHSQRAPMFYELLANGVHVASGAFERGDATLGLERAKGVDLGAAWHSDSASMHFNVYQTRFANYIALDATGDTMPGEEEGETIPVYAFRAVPAKLQGFEIEGRWNLPETLRPAGTLLTLTAQLDGVQGSNRATGEPLPRLAPLRASLGLEAQRGDWTSRVDWRLAARQDRVAALDTATAGYGTLRLSVARQFRIGESDALWYLKLDNLGNKLAYNATAVATIRELAPQAGRSLHTGLQVRF